MPDRSASSSQAEDAHRLEQAQRAERVGIGGIFGRLEAHLDMAVASFPSMPEEGGHRFRLKPAGIPMTPAHLLGLALVSALLIGSGDGLGVKVVTLGGCFCASSRPLG